MTRRFAPLLLLALPLFGCPRGGGAVERGPLAQVQEADAHAILEAGASSLDFMVRMRAIEHLVRTSPEEAGGSWGPRGIYDPDPYVRSRAALALGERLHEPRSRELLLAFVARDGDPYVRGATGLRLVQAGELAAVEPLREAYRAQKEHWKRAPLALPVAVAGDAEALAALQAALSRGDFPLEISFFLDCGRSGLPLADALEAGMPRVEEEMRLALAAALLQLGSPKGEQALRDALGSGDLQVRLEALDYLRDLPGESATELVRRARLLGPAPVRDYAEAILVARGELAPDAIFGALQDPDRETRMQAAWGLGRWLVGAADEQRRLARRSRGALVDALGDSESVVVEQAVRALAEGGTPDEIGALSAVIVVQDAVSLQVEAAGAIARIHQRKP